MEAFRLFWFGKLQPVHGSSAEAIYNYLQKNLSYFGDKSIAEYSVSTNYRSFTGVEFLDYYKNR